MMQQLVFATHNNHKTAEVQRLLGDRYEILNLSGIGCHEDIPETADSFAGNAALKSNHVTMNYGLDCFADDSGLEIEALNNEPGIYSARYSGVKDDQQNLELVLHKLRGISNRNARFRTVISLNYKGEHLFFEGLIEGTIRYSLSGHQGFGYDPVFEPAGYNLTFAEMSMDEKNLISHRAIAMRKLIAFLQEQASPF